MFPLDGGEYTFFKKDEAKKRFLTVKQNDAHWLEVKGNTKGQVHIDFVSKAPREESEPSPGESSADDAEGARRTAAKRRDKGKGPEQRAAPEVTPLYLRPPKLVVSGKRRKPCALCEHHFPAESLTSEHLRSSVCEMRRILYRLQKIRKTRIPTSIQDQRKTRRKKASLGSAETDPMFTKYKFARVYDKVKVCAFCSQFFPYDAFRRGIRERRGAMVRPTTAEAEIERSNTLMDLAANQVPQHEARLSEIGPSLSAHPLLTETLDIAEMAALERAPSLGSELSTTSDFLPDLTPKLPTRFVGGYTKRKHERTLKTELEQIREVVEALEGRLRGKPADDYDARVERLFSADAAPWVPSSGAASVEPNPVGIFSTTNADVERQAEWQPTPPTGPKRPGQARPGQRVTATTRATPKKTAAAAAAAAAATKKKKKKKKKKTKAKKNKEQGAAGNVVLHKPKTPLEPPPTSSLGLKRIKTAVRAIMVSFSRVFARSWQALTLRWRRWLA